MANENKQLSFMLKESKQRRRQRKNNAENKEINMIALMRTHLKLIFLPSAKADIESSH